MQNYPDLAYNYLQDMGKRRKPKSRYESHKRFLIILVLSATASAAGWWYVSGQKGNNLPPQTSEVVVQQSIPETPPKKGILKIFTAVQFRDLYNNFAYPNTEYISDSTPITGNPEADKHIRMLAEKRGYIKRSAPVTNNFKNVGDEMMLQERAAAPWLDLQAAAKKDGNALALTAAYRSADEQKEIFLSRLGNLQLSAVSNGAYDGRITQVLSMTALPGYSRHHTGYTVDIGCGNDPAVVFERSACFDWLSADNYKNTKRFGWIPSYPEGVTEQGPEPESWEYVWVGLDALTE